MAIRTDVTVDFSVNPRVITVASPSVTILIQDLNDTLRNIEAQLPTAQQFLSLCKVAGKDSLGSVGQVGITCTLTSSQLSFAARGGPSFVQCTVNGGNLVAVDANNNAISAIFTTAFTQVIIQQSTSPTLVTTAAGGNTLPKKNTALSNFHFELRDSATHLPKTGVTGITGTIAKDNAVPVALTNGFAEIGNGMYLIVGGLTAGELNADVATLRFTAAGVDDTQITVVLAI